MIKILKNISNRSLNLFLSYGHEEATTWLVLQIKKFFESRNHHIWMDKELIREGADWRREIIEGINASNNVLAFLTQYAIGKEHAVCLDELRISVSIPGMNVISILLETEENLNIPCTISRNQYIDMSDWQKIKNTPNWENYFNEKMLSLAEWIESEEHFQFQGEITTVKNMLLPDISDCKYYSLLEKMVGREWLSNEFDGWLSGNEKFLIIFGGPGTGKSQFSAHKAHYNPDIIAMYFCEFDKINDNTAKNFVRSICFQIATKFPDFRHWIINENDILYKNDAIKNLSYFNETSDGELFLKLIIEPLSKTINGNLGNKCILIDGLDEITKNNDNPIIDMLIANGNLTPTWIKFAITSRPEEAIVNTFQGYPSISLEDERSKKDLYKYISSRLCDMVDSSTINEIAAKSEYMFIFAEKYCDALEDGLIIQNNIPDSIGGLYYHYFKRIFTVEKYKQFRKSISVIISFDLCDLTEETFNAIMGYTYDEFNEFLFTLKSFIKLEQDGAKRTIRFYHKSIKDWLVNQEQSGCFYVDVDEGRKNICEFCEKVLNAPSDFSFDILKNSYVYTKKYGNVNQKKMLNQSFSFLTILQKLAYERTDISLFRDICTFFNNIIELRVKPGSDVEWHCAQSYFLECQFEIDRDNKEFAQKKLMCGKKLFKKILKKDFCLYAEVEENLFWARDILLKKEKTMLKLIKKAEAKSPEENRHQILSNLYFSYSTYLYQTKNYNKALECLDKALKSVNFIEYENAQNNTLFRIYNQKGDCLSRLSKYDDAIECYKLSLDLRLQTYGKFNHYTAIGYDALARGYIYKAENENESIGDEVLMLAETALKINNTLFGEDNKMSARNLYTLALIHSRNNNYMKALEYANKSIYIYKKFHDISANNMLDTFISELKRYTA